MMTYIWCVAATQLSIIFIDRLNGQSETLKKNNYLVSEHFNIEEYIFC